MHRRTWESLLIALVFSVITIGLAFFSVIFFNNHLTQVAEMFQSLTVSGIADAIVYKPMLAKSSYSGIVFLIGSGLYLSRRNFRKILHAPIIELTSQVASLNPADIGKGIPIPKNSDPEINTLTMTINRLLTSIVERQKELEDRVSERTMELQAMKEELNMVNETLMNDLLEHRVAKRTAALTIAFQILIDRCEELRESGRSRIATRRFRRFCAKMRKSR